jgi:RNA polymerase sigma-70 factor (ECF subfamily)
VIELRFADEQSIAETARVLGRSEGAVKQLQLRAMKTLRERLDEHDA